MRRIPCVLVVDDVEKNRLLLSGVVESLGYKVETARDGLDALAKLPLGIDLVLLDVMMPGLDGFEVVKRLRADARYAKLPVIMVTAGGPVDAVIAGLGGHLEPGDHVVTSAYDGIHFDPDQQQKLGTAIAAALRPLLAGQHLRDRADDRQAAGAFEFCCGRKACLQMAKRKSRPDACANAGNQDSSQ